MWIHFDHPGYEDLEPLEVPDRNFMDVFTPRNLGAIDEDNVIACAFQAPLGSTALRDRVRTDDRVVILVDDASRQTPVARVLPRVVEELMLVGVPEESITVLIASETRRRMTDEELTSTLGSLAGALRVEHHDWRSAARHHLYGRTRDGTRVEVNELLASVECVLGLGSIAPDRLSGFSGGADVAVPGAAGRELVERIAWESAMQMTECVLGRTETPMRLRMEEAAAMAGLRHVVDVVVDRSGRIAGCFTGDATCVHRSGAALSRKLNAVHLPARADIVIIDAYPHDRDLMQSCAALHAGRLAVRDGGSLILISPSPEGATPDHPSALQLGYRPQAELTRLVQRGSVDLAGAAQLARIAEVRDHVDCVLVSAGVDRAAAEQLGLRWARTCEDALRLALDRQGRDASIAVLRYGGRILPLAGPRSWTPAGTRDA